MPSQEVDTSNYTDIWIVWLLKNIPYDLLLFCQNVVELLVAISFRFAGLSIIIKHVYRDIYRKK